MDKRIAMLASDFRGRLGGIETRLSKVERGQAELVATTTNLKLSLRADLEEHSGHIETVVASAVIDEVKKIRDPTHGSVADGFESSFAYNRFVGRMGDLLERVEEVEEQLQREARLGRSSSTALSGINACLRAGGGVIRINGKDFGSPEEVVKFWKAHNVSVGCAGDAFLLMNLPRNLIVDEELFLKNQKGRNDTKLGSWIETCFVSSFVTTVPASLAPQRANVGEVTSRAKLLEKVMKSYSDWESEDLASGIRKSVEYSSTHVQGRIHNFSSMADGLTPQGAMFCSKLTSDSHLFVTDFTSWITGFYRTHLALSGMSEEALWGLCLEVIGYITNELCLARQQFIDSAPGEPALYFWGLLKAWEIQQRYRTNKFANDPALNGIFVRRALLRKSGAMVQAEKKLAALELGLRQAETKIATLNKTVKK